MKFAIISHTPHGFSDGNFFAYAPYVREMNLWNQYADEVTVVAPLNLSRPTDIHLRYSHPNINVQSIPAMDLLSWRSVCQSLWQTPRTCLRIYKAMKKADHIHLRCPGNIGLLGCLVQILFPKKKKTAKYAGNWDPKAPQPKSYKLQRWILNNTFLTKNMKVLVYGEWPHCSENILPFFTATYRETDKIEVEARPLIDKINFLFVGSLAVGKRPLYAVKLIEKLSDSGHEVQLALYGDGEERSNLEQYIAEKKLPNVVIMGNQTEAVVRKAYQSAHFLLLPSKSEGWPKVVAEAMFWRCFPIATAVSCVPFMLDQENRGMLLQMNLEADVNAIDALLNSPEAYAKKVSDAMNWSRNYTLDLFEDRIKNLLAI